MPHGWSRLVELIRCLSSLSQVVIIVIIVLAMTMTIMLTKNLMNHHNGVGYDNKSNECNESVFGICALVGAALAIWLPETQGR